ncbi:MAG TPA: hypothetical protein VN154_07310 [Rhizomicrobium sp.]|nr:hypothetical protein [Rhizomicrobium sp.]
MIQAVAARVYAHGRRAAGGLSRANQERLSWFSLPPFGRAKPPSATEPRARIVGTLWSWNETLPLRLFARSLACTTDGFCFLPGLAL